MLLPKVSTGSSPADVGLDTGGATSNLDLSAKARTEVSGPKGFLGLSRYKLPKDSDVSKE